MVTDGGWGRCRLDFRDVDCGLEWCLSSSGKANERLRASKNQTETATEKTKKRREIEKTELNRTNAVSPKIEPNRL